MVTGRANSGKTGKLFEAIERAAREGGSALVLLPTGPDVLRVRREFASRCAVGVGVDRFSAHVDARWGLLGDGRRIVAPALRTALVGEASTTASLGALAASAAKPGFAGSFGPVLARLVEYDRRVLEPTTDIDEGILALLDRYEVLATGAGLVERGRASLWLAGEPPAGGIIAVHRFADLSPSQESLVRSWSLGGAEVLVSLPWEADFPPTSALDPFVARLLPGATHIVMPAAEPADELEWFGQGLYARGPSRRAGGSVVFAEAVGDEAECALVAERVEGLLLGTSGLDPLPPDGIAVVFRDPSRRVSGLTAAFRSRGIPFDLDVNVALADTPLGSAFCQLMGFSTDPVRRDLLAGLLRGPFCDAVAADVDGLEAAWRRRRETRPEELLRSACGLGTKTRRILTMGRHLAAGVVAGAQEESKALLDLMVSCSWTGERLGSSEDAASAARDHGGLLSYIEQLAALGDLAPSPGSLPGLLRSTTVNAGVPRPGHVQITEAHRLRGRRFEAVIVGGLTADEFSSQDRSSLAVQVAERLTGSRAATDQSLERLLFYQVVTRARTRLELVRLAADSQGAVRRPSVFWEEARDPYRVSDSDQTESGNVATVKLSVATTDRGAPMITGDRRILRAAARRRGEQDPVRLTGPAPVLADADLLGRLAAREEFSVTELETYSRCPYRWFLERAVRPTELDREVDARAAGLMVHEVLRRTYGRLADETGDSRVTAATLDSALRLLDEVFDEVLAQQPVAAASLAEEDLVVQARLRASASLKTDAASFPGFAPAELEVAFGTAAGRPVKIAGISLRGRIDRVDRDGDRLVVIDYKWSAGTPNAKFEALGVVQLPLYAAVAEQLMGARCVSGLYRGLARGESRGWWIGEPSDRHADLVGTDAVDEERAREIVQEASARAAEAAAGIRAGTVAPLPRVADACRTCGAAPHCARAIR